LREKKGDTPPELAGKEKEGGDRDKNKKKVEYIPGTGEDIEIPV